MLFCFCTLAFLMRCTVVRPLAELGLTDTQYQAAADIVSSAVEDLYLATTGIFFLYVILAVVVCTDCLGGNRRRVNG